MTELGQLIDHAAELRRDINQLKAETQLLAVGLLGWQLWREP